jgi:hypothetical protein
VVKWFKPGQDAFAIGYRDDVVYEPDFVVETKTVSGKPWAYQLIRTTLLQGESNSSPPEVGRGRRRAKAGRKRRAARRVRMMKVDQFA